jgi:hypothetical protein
MYRFAERRARRSEDPKLALKYQLEASQELARFESLFILDSEKNLIACPEESAAVEKLKQTIQLPKKEEFISLSQDKLKINIKPFIVKGRRFFLVGIGGKLPEAKIEMLRCIRGLIRILKQSKN